MSRDLKRNAKIVLEISDSFSCNNIESAIDSFKEKIRAEYGYHAEIKELSIRDFWTNEVLYMRKD